MEPLYKAYGEVVEYAKHLESLLKAYTVVDDEVLSKIRKKHLKPSTNVAKEWLGE